MKIKSIKFFKIIIFVLCFFMVFEQSGFAQIAGELDISGHFLALRNNFMQDRFRPLHLRYLAYDPSVNNFNLLLDKGDSLKGMSPKGADPKDSLQQGTKTLLNYFFIGISLPNEAFWVNLRPDAEGNIIDNELAETDVGKILLEADLQLKKDTANFTSPQTLEGKDYWDKLYKKAEELYGSESITIPTLTRPWIVPDEIIIRESSDNAYIYKATLKVMLEQDYLKDSSTYSFKDERSKTLNEYSSELIRETIIPKLTKEINSSKKYAPLRQVYYSLILAQWFKQKFYGKSGVYSYLIDRHNLDGLTSETSWSKTTYFNAYKTSFQQGEYNIKEPRYTPYGQVIRNYMSGGLALQELLGNARVIPGSKMRNPIEIFGVRLQNNIPALVYGSNLAENITIGKIEIGAKEMVPTAVKQTAAIEQPSIASSGIVNYWDKFIRFIKDIKLYKPALQELSGEGYDKLRYTPFVPTKKNIIQSARKAFAYSDSSQDFFGVDLEYFVHTQNRLIDKLLTKDELNKVLAYLEIPKQITEDEDYRRIFEELTKGNYNKEVLEIINGLTYDNPRLDVEITKQNQNARAQGVYEAVANSLDALEFKIGQFGKGVKQILSWLQPTGEDRVDVFTRKENGRAYQLTILKDKTGQNYIQIKEIQEKEFQDATQAAGETVTHGTIVRVKVQNKISRTDQERTEKQFNSQEEIVEGLRKRFAYVPAAEIFVQGEKLNGFETKEVIVPPGGSVGRPQDSRGKRIHVFVNEQTITIIDNGIGMDAEVLSRMFVPKKGTKPSEPLSGETSINNELKKVKVVRDSLLAHRVSFSRNSEVVVAVDIPEDVHKDATMPGGLMIEFGALLDVPESRDNIIIPLDLKPGVISNFQWGIQHAIAEIMNHRKLSNLDKVLYINTIVVGLEGLIKGNSNYEYTIKSIRAYIRNLKEWNDILTSLKQEGFIILPHGKQFAMIDLQGKKAIFLNEYLFNWRGAVNLDEIGGEKVPLVTLGGDKNLPLVIISFTEESLGGVREFNRDWHTWSQDNRLPIIKTDRFIAIPMQGCARFLELAKTRAKGEKLSAAEEGEFRSILQRINIITAKEVETSYEITKPKENLLLFSPADFKSEGEVDSNAVNNFLIKPPIQVTKETTSVGQVPQDASMKYILLENGDLMAARTKEVVETNVQHLEPLRNGYYKIIKEVSGQSIEFIFNPDLGKDHSTSEVIIKPNDKREFVISPSKRYVFKRDPVTLQFSRVIDLESRKEYYPTSEFMPFRPPPPPSEKFIDIEKHSPSYDLQFSADEKYLTYLWKDTDGKVSLVIVDTAKTGIHKKVPFNVLDVEHAINPFANVAFVKVKNKDIIALVDLEKGEVVATAKFLHTDSTGTYTAIVKADGKMSIYLHKTKKILEARDLILKTIDIVHTYWKDGKTYFTVTGKNLMEGNEDAEYFFNENGPLIIKGQLDEDFSNFNYAEMFNGERIYFKRWSETAGTQMPFIKNGSLLQRLDRRGAYKHPYFDLFIDHSDPENPVAINPKTDDKISYKGKIFHYEQEAARVWSLYNGKVYCSLPQVTQEQPEYVVIDDSLPAKFSIHRGFVHYYINIYDHPNAMPHQVSLQIPVDKYTHAYFEGKYVVFTDPKTGDFIYLNPENPGELIESKQNKTTSGDIPSGQGYVLLENGDFIEARSGNIIEKNVKKAEYLSHGYYIITTDTEKFSYNPSLGKLGQNSSYYETAGHDFEFEFIVSPSKRYVTRQSLGGVGYVMDLESGQMYYLDNDFSTKPSPESEALAQSSMPTSYHDLQFSHDEKYATYLKKDDQGKVFFVIVDLEKGKIIKHIDCWDSLLGNVAYSLNPFANVAFVRFKDDQYLNMFVNLATGFILPAELCHADSTGTYTALILNGELSIYLHKPAKWFHKEDFKLRKIESVFTGWDEQGKIVFGVSDEDAPFDGEYFDENGQIINDPDFRPVKFYYELFTSQGRKMLFGNDNISTEPLADVKVDSFQEINHKGLYKHPYLNLFINDSDPSNPVAINPLSGRKFRYQGQVIGSNYSAMAFNSEAPETTPEYDYIVVENKGEISALENERETKGGPYRLKSRGTLHQLWIKNAVISNTTPCYAVGIDTGGTYQFYRIPSNHKPEPVPELGSFMDENILISPRDYPYVYFDGNYFVFTNPISGDVRKLNPKDSKDPLITTTQKIDTKPANNIPDDAHQRLFLRNGELVEIGTGRSVLSGVQDMETLGNGYYKIVTHSQEEIRRFSAAENGYELEKSKFFVHRDEGRILLSSDKRFAYYQRPDATIGYAVFCLEDEEAYYLETGFSADFAEYDKKSRSRFSLEPGAVRVIAPPIFSNLQFSNDGRYLTYVEKNHGENPQLVIVELNQNKIILQNAKKTIKHCPLPENSDYAINPFANAVFIQDKDTGLMKLYDLKEQVTLIGNVKYLRTDSSGSYTILIKINGEVNLFHHKTGNLIKADIAGGRFGSICTSYFKDGSKKIVIWSMKGDKAAWLNDDGSVEELRGNVDFDKTTATEQFDFSDNVLYIWYGISNLTESKYFSELDPLQRLNKNALYFDTRLKLIISHSDTNDNIAIDPDTEIRIPYSGTVVKYEAGLKELVYEDDKDGGKLKASWLDGKSRKISETSATFDNIRKYVIMKSGRGYIFRDSDEEAGADAIRGVDSGKYSFVLFDGKYFVFINPVTTDAVYFDANSQPRNPVFVSFQGQKEVDLGIEEQNKVIELWNKHIALKRNDFIAQAQAVYQPFLELFPEEYRGGVEGRISEGIEKIYREQEREILRRFQAIVDGRMQALDSKELLPFDRFQQRMSLFMKSLPRYIGLIANQISQEKPEYQKEFYDALFTNLFELSLNFSINLEALDKTLIANGSLFEVLAFDWRITSQEQLKAVPIISSLIKNLREATNNQVELLEIAVIVITLSYFSAKDPIKNIPILEKQLGKILKLKQEAKIETLVKLHDAFYSIEDAEEVRPFIDNPYKSNNLGKARPFITFLTNDVEQVKEKARFIPQGEDKKLPESGVEISQIVKLEQQRQKTGEDDVVMSMEEVVGHLIDQKHKLPTRSEAGEAEILKNTKVQRESGAYPAEITQNSRDATVGQKGELVVDYYLQENGFGEKEYVEEAVDNGPGALHEVALIIPKSTKDTGEQLELTGFFGTGKYTIFEGVDRVEIINKNQKRAYMFTFNVIKDDTGTPQAIKLTGIRQINDGSVKQGVTVRRIKKIDNTIPELDQMLSQRAWKVFAGLSQNDNFKIYFIDHENKRAPLTVEKEVLTEADFRAQRPGEEQETNFGKMKIISTKDMPLQIVDKAGLRVCEIKEEYLALIPEALRWHIDELGIVIQVPLPLIRNRSAFEYENEYLPVIQKYIAIEFYKAIAYLTLTRTNPQFVFEGFPLDWETNDHYWYSIGLNDTVVVSLARKINEGKYAEIREDELQNLRTEKGKLDKEKKFVKALLLLKVATDSKQPDSKISLFLRRLAIQKEIDEFNAQRQAEMLKDAGMEIGKIPDIKDIPYHEKKLRQAGTIMQGHEQLSRPQDYIIPAKNTEERALLDLAISIARYFGIRQVLLVNTEAKFAGAFIKYKNEHGELVSTMLINQSLAFQIGERLSGAQDEATDTVIHELGHLLEGLMHSDTNALLQEGYVAHMTNFTHDAVGTFAEAMKYVAVVSLLGNVSSAINMISETEQLQKLAAGSPVAETKEDTIEFHYERGYFIKQVGTAVVNLARYLKAGEFAAIIISGDSAVLTLPFIKKAWGKLSPQVPFPPVFTFQGRRLYTDPNIVNSEVDTMASLPQEDGASVLFRDIKDKRICFVDDFRQSGTKYRGVSRNLLALGVKNASFAFIVASEKANSQEYFSGAVDSWLPIDMDRLTWEQRKKKSAPGLEVQNRWDGIFNFIQDSSYTEEAHGAAAGSPVVVFNSASSVVAEGPIKTLRKRISREAGGKEIVEFDPKNELLSILVEHIKSGQPIELKLNALKSGTAYYIALFDLSQQIENLSQMLNEAFSKDYGWPIDFALREAIKNAFVHGNKMNFNAPIFIYLDLQNKRIIVGDVALENSELFNLDRARNARLGGESQGVKEIEEVYGLTHELLDIKDASSDKIVGKIALIKKSVAGSPVVLENSVSSPAKKELGGIDMRSLSKNTVIQPMASSNVLKQGLSPKGTVPVSIVSDKEWQQIERMVNSHIAPSCERLREYLLSLQDPNSQTDKVLACIADILRQEEEKAGYTEASLREILVLLEADKPVNELRLALAKVQVSAKEPELIAQ